MNHNNIMQFPLKFFPFSHILCTRLPIFKQSSLLLKHKLLILKLDNSWLNFEIKLFFPYSFYICDKAPNLTFPIASQLILNKVI